MESDKILSEVKSLSRTIRACSHYRVDLHVHSPASSDYLGDRDVSPYEFVSAFAAQGFELIAITDHNTGEYVDEAITACNQIASEEGKIITILPGVELNVSPGIHLLAILPEGGSAAISDLLSRLGLPNRQHGDPSKLVSQPIEEIARIVHQRKGLLIGAHCNSTHGIVNTLDGQTRLEWLRAVDALEVNSESAEEKIDKTVCYVANELDVSIPFTFGSDSHDCASESTGMWVKMAEPSLTSLRQLTFEPELRVSRTEPSALSHGRIVGFTTTHGIYGKERFQFSPHLNVIIGGRGAGKSAAIDLIRFAFEAEPGEDDASYEIFKNRIIGFLQLSGEVLVVVVGADDETYVITRCGAYEKPSSRATPVFTESAQVYQVVGNDLVARDLRPMELLGIEFYGQGEVARLANRVNEQLRLIDENLDHSDATSLISETEEQLAVGESQLIKHQQRLEKLRAEVANRAHLEENRERLAKSLADPIFSEHSRWGREQIWIQGRQDWVQAMLACLPESVPSITDVPIEIEQSFAKSTLEKIQAELDQVLKSACNDLRSFRKTLEGVTSQLEEYRAEWNAALKVAEEKYRSRLAELGVSNLDQVAVEHRSVDEELTRIETTVEPEIEQIESKITLLENDRTILLAKLTDARSAIACSRSKFVDELNAELDGNVVVELSGEDTSLFFEAINEPLRGSGMQQRENQLLFVCDSFPPSEFVEIVRAKSKERLTAVGMTENNASRMIGTLLDDVLYKVERIEVPQLPSIRIKREGETVFTDLKELSVGEKCSAILSIALLSKGKPLVIDQPEDDLDHAFIVDSIVRGIRTAKSGRQIIAATHNPNIPVLGDAEMVFRVAHQPGNDICHIQNSGGLELPRVTEEVQSLEGGAEAFERRRQRYSGVS